MQSAHRGYFQPFGPSATDNTERGGDDCYYFIKRGAWAPLTLNRRVYSILFFLFYSNPANSQKIFI